MSTRDLKWNERQHDIDHRAEEQRQIDQVRADGEQRRKDAQMAILKLAFAREQLLALSMLIYERARAADSEGHYGTAALLNTVARMVRDIRANQPVDVLQQIGKPRGADAENW